MVQVVLGSDFRPWMARHQGYSIVMIRMAECGPCHRTYPMYCKLAEKWNGDARFQFGSYTMEREDNDLLKFLKVKAVPTFQVYQSGEQIFQTSGPKNLPTLNDYLQELP